MKEAEIAMVLQESEGRVCTRLYRRSDGTVITKDCPVGARLVRRMRIIGGAVAAVLSFGIYNGVQDKDPDAQDKIALQQCVESVINLPIVQGGLDLYRRFFLRIPPAAPPPVGATTGVLVYGE